MVQIVRRKKKGRPSKADLARRLAGESPAKEPEVRRSHRRRNARYSAIDYDDYIDEEEEEFEEDEDDEENRRREKKVRLVVKLSRDEVAAETARRERGGHAPPDSEEDEESEGERKRKKRRIDDVDDDDYDGGGGGEDNGDGDGDENDGVCVEDDEEERARKVDTKRLDSVPGTPTEPRTAIPLPDKKILETILDKLQKKDTYGVYAEPVDPEELPDYHDVIEHPMDFATVRKRLADGSYSTLEQLESDVILICSNAMQYNSSDTVYHKQARNIQELGRKKFEKLRIKFENSEREMKLVQKLKSNSMVNKFESSEEEMMKSAQKIKSNPAIKKHIKRPMYRTSQETVGSDFSSGATLATAGEILNSMNLIQSSGCDKATNNDVNAEVLNDVNLDKADETSSAKGFPSKLGRKPINLEDNRRGTYNISTQPVVKPESVFTTFESETKQLVAVGLHAEYAYARSLARFSATLGPIAWKVASQRIEQSLPAGCKFGRGWVGEYEPLPTPVLLLENHKQKQSGLVTKNNNSSGETRKNERAFKTPVPMKEKADSGHFTEGRQPLFVPARVPQSDVKPSAFSSAGPQSETKSLVFSSAGTQSEAKSSAFSSAGPRSEAKPSAFSSAGRKSNNAAGNAQPRNFPNPENNYPKHVEMNDLGPAANQKKAEIDSEKPFSRNPESPASKLRDVNNHPQSGLLPNGKDQQGGSDNPVRLMKVLAEKTQKKPSDQPIVDAPSARREDPNNAAAAAARAWMSIGAGAFKQPAEPPKSQISAESLYNPARELSQPQIVRVRGEFPVAAGGPGHPFPVPAAAFFPQPLRFGNEAVHFPNRPIMFPQLAAADLSRFQMQPQWHSLGPQAPPRQKQDSLPPDLNIGFQPPQSPVKQSSGVIVESQQPDLALQL